MSTKTVKTYEFDINPGYLPQEVSNKKMDINNYAATNYLLSNWQRENSWNGLTWDCIKENLPPETAMIKSIIEGLSNLIDQDLIDKKFIDGVEVFFPTETLIYELIDYVE